MLLENIIGEFCVELLVLCNIVVVSGLLILCIDDVNICCGVVNVLVSSFELVKVQVLLCVGVVVSYFVEWLVFLVQVMICVSMLIFKCVYVDIVVKGGKQV